MDKVSRRMFLRSGAAAGFFISAGRIYGQAVAAGDQKLRVLHVGTGGMGQGDANALSATGKVIFAGLCDTDPARLAEARQRFPGAPATTDFRELFDRHAAACDAVCISTPDHTHALIALEAMKRGKHVYVQKPLARTFRECEMLLESARKYKVVTQMGNQGHPGVYRYEKLWANKYWGEVLDVHSWTNRPVWPQGMKRLPQGEETPAGYNWDCWLGPAAARKFSRAYVPFNWRGWKDFGSGAIGDMAVHNFDPAYWLLADGKLPERICAWVNSPSDVAFPAHSTIDFRFGATSKCPAGFNVYWYEGGLRPKASPGAHPKFMVADNGLIINGTRASTIAGSHAGAPSGLAATGRAFGDETRALRRECSQLLKGTPGVKERWAYNHYGEWVDACIANRPEDCGSRMEYAVPLTQTLLFGCIAQFLPGRELFWDAAARKFNDDAANQMLECADRPGFELKV